MSPGAGREVGEVFSRMSCGAVWGNFVNMSFLLNRSIQENGELKIESKIEEVSSFPVFCSYFVVMFVNFGSLACAGTFLVRARC